MNRPIKFRGKPIQMVLPNGEYLLGDFVFGNLLVHKNGTHRILVPIDGGFENFAIAPSTLGQFTGLYDKNGAEIYEGDILQAGRSNASICVVFWSTERAAFAYRFYWQKIDDTQEIGRKTSCRYTIGDWMKIEKNLAVIDNIHDNNIDELIEKIE